MKKRDILLWTSILLSPLAWFANLCINYAIAPLTCGGHGKIASSAISIAALIVTVLCGLLALRLLQREKGVADRSQAMSIAGAVISAGFFLVIVAQAIPQILFSGCE